MKSNDAGYQLAGWVLFVLSAILFIVSSARHGDAPALLGSTIFLLACIVFLVPLLKGLGKSEGNRQERDDQDHLRPPE